MCGDLIECESDQLKCEDGSRCIPEHLYCDGEEHCEDKSDEKLCSDNIYKVKQDISTNATDPCNSVLPVCSQTCLATSHGYKCDCIEGYVKVI